MKRAKSKTDNKPIMSDKEMIGRTIKNFDEIQDSLKSTKVVEDYHICYGSKEPLCGNELGSKGLVKDWEFTTCPECLMKLGDND